MSNDEFTGFYKKSVAERRALVAKTTALDETQTATIAKEGGLPLELADRMIENVIGTHALPLGVATNFIVDGKPVLIPFAVEEPSVVAASSYAAKLTKDGFTTDADEPVMIGQIQLTGIADTNKAKEAIEAQKQALIDYANKIDPCVLVKFGGGLRDIEVRVLESERGKMVIVHLLVDCRDAMGANAVNTLAETLAPKLEELSAGKVRLRIISNLAVHRKARAKATWTKESLEESTKGTFKGSDVVEAILDAYAFADADPYRATTHNKGIMNGIDAVVIATGNDWRAIEAGAHSYASITGKYKPLTKYFKDANGDLVGEIELPMAIGLVGGATKTHPTAQANVKILGVKSAQELARIIAAVGLAQNFAALRALATEGINRGHLKLHAKNIAIMAGAIGTEIDLVAEKMANEKRVRVDRAQELLKELRT
ncbi:hydroxymethylglutaryl-CoA reductase, degradative [Candidatus Micrarchaeota archaeon CG1_02_55_22]|nr:MAG: hydroxymethylglutaryl-CoA reductase, degradative [Candidatus Micrarchaeota archaeon CG1_02_55_22]